MRIYKTVSLQQKIEKWSEFVTESGCRLWTGAIHHSGYGVTSMRGKSLLAHRAAWELVFGPIPAGMRVCHKCDVPACCNVAHLFLGTDADNQADCKDKGRKLTGLACPRAKLSDEQVSSIVMDGRKHREIAAEYGIGLTYVTAIKCNRGRPPSRYKCKTQRLAA